MTIAAARPDGGAAVVVFPPNHLGDGGWQRQALPLAALATLLRLAWPVGLDLYGDEAYYYAWSRRLAFGYFDHPPLVAWLCALGRLLGRSELCLRLPFALCGGLSVFFAAGIAAELTRAGSPEGLWDARAPWLAALLAAVAPLALVTSALALPDAPLTAASTACVWLLLRERRRDLAYAGLAFGLALLAKYSAATLLPGFVWILLRDPRARAALRTKAACLGVALAAATFAPCLVWNAQHGFVSLAFQLHHASHGSGAGLAPGTLRDFALAELFGAGPVTLLFALPYLWTTQTPAARRLAAVTFAPLGWFAYAALRGKFEANWPAFLDPALCAAAAAGLGQLRERTARALWIPASVLACSATFAAGLELRHPRFVAPNNVLVARFHQGRALAAAVRPRLPPGDPFVYTYDYQDAGELAFYAGLTRLGPAAERRSQLDLWNAAPAPGETFFALGSGDDGAHQGLTVNGQPRFPGATAGPAERFLLMVDGQPIRAVTLTALTP